MPSVKHATLVVNLPEPGPKPDSQPTNWKSPVRPMSIHKVMAAVQAALASQAQAYESQLAESRKAMLRLEDHLDNLQVNPKAATPQHPKRAGSEPAPNSLKPRLAQTPVRATPTVQFTPKATHKTASQPSGSTPAKKRPNQVTTADYPKGFEGTKVSGLS
ncbi:hypothetical protein CROQUDRAFT_146395 [Cronartium quercuum f. sp. fusiforme G11]|uniref:Uncharacterized protein n=1 Tax=Cronartium quercuum f. sp. fusiforme G11 TaxID=708437 RepID=A0A9P6NUQ6_9BASI|nr:hypothetical protein CROQUDRAFT_146395 [Cronartium quercuum f. sp. fusiforme G11]